MGACNILFITGLAATCLGKDSQSFLAIGDWGGDDDFIPASDGEKDNNEGMAIAAAGLNGIDSVLALGDNFYETGIQGSSSSFRFRATFEDVFTAPELQVPWYIVAGNHDHKGNVTAEIAYSALSTRWTYPAYWYSISRSFTDTRNVTISTEFVFIDTVLLTGDSYRDPVTGKSVPPAGPEDPALAQTQLEWIEATLKNSTANYLWVAGHFPVLSQCEHGPTQKIIDEVVPLMVKYNATGYLAGHDHCLGHFDYSNLTLVLSGAGRGCCYKPEHESVIPTGAMKFHLDSGNKKLFETGGFASLTANSTATVVNYYNSHGTMLYTSDPVPPRR